MRMVRVLCVEIALAVLATLMLVAPPVLAHFPGCAGSSMERTVARGADDDCDLLAASGHTGSRGPHHNHALCHPTGVQPSSIIGLEWRNPELPAAGMLPAVTIAYRVDTRSSVAPAGSLRVDPPPSILFGNFRS